MSCDVGFQLSTKYAGPVWFLLRDSNSSTLYRLNRHTSIVVFVRKALLLRASALVESTNSECASSHWRNRLRSVLSLRSLDGRRSLCCSDVPICTHVKFSRALQIGTHHGSAWTHFVKVLSVIPRPCVIPPDVFRSRMSDCSMVWSENTPFQNLSSNRIVKKPFSVN